MANVPVDRKYTREHEWVMSKDDNTVTIGITDYAQNSLGDIVFIELPEVGRTLAKDEIFGVVESVKAASDLYSAVSGEVSAIHEEINDAPDTVNKDPYNEGWMIEVSGINSAELDELMDAEAYEAFIASL